MLFNNDVDQFKSLAIGHRDSVTVLDDQHVSGFSLLKLRKSVFSDRIYTILLLYRSHQETVNSFLNNLSTVLSEFPDIDIILGDFNIDILKETVERQGLLECLGGFFQLVTSPTHIDGGAIDHIFVRTPYDYTIDGLKFCTCLSDHDGLKIEIS